MIIKFNSDDRDASLCLKKCCLFFIFSSKLRKPLPKVMPFFKLKSIPGVEGKGIKQYICSFKIWRKKKIKPLKFLVTSSKIANFDKFLTNFRNQLRGTRKKVFQYCSYSQ